MSIWPRLQVADWEPTRETLHLWTQIVGKVQLAKAPMINHWWQVGFSVTTRGLTTGAIPDGDRVFELQFDFVDQVLRVEVLGGRRREVTLAPKPTATFYAETMEALRSLDVAAGIWPVPVEIDPAVPFEQDRAERVYEPDQAYAFWLQLVQASRVLTAFRGRYAGKVSPVHLFWGALDLAVTRFSGNPAPRRLDAPLRCTERVLDEGFSHELASCGFWPGGGAEGLFYAYAYPEPWGYGDRAVRPEGAYYSAEAKQFFLPYEAVRTAAAPDATLLDFLQDTYVAAAELGDWDRALDYTPLDPV